MNKKLKPPFLSTGFNDSKKGARERFSNIFTNNKKRNGFAVFMIIALLGIGASVLVSCRNISAPATEAEAEVQNGAKTLDNIISEILLSDSDGRFMSGECKGEGHRIFASEDWERGYNNILKTVFESHSGLVILPIQDLLGYGSDTRLNIPGKADGNWQFRITKDQLNTIDKEKFKKYNRIYGRN